MKKGVTRLNGKNQQKKNRMYKDLTEGGKTSSELKATDREKQQKKETLWYKRKSKSANKEWKKRINDR